MPTSQKVSKKLALRDAIDATRAVGSWIIAYGFIFIVIEPLIATFEYKKNNSNQLPTSLLLITALIIALIIGGLIIRLGIKVKRTTDNNLLRSDKILKIVGFTIVALMLLNIIAGGGVGLLNIIFIFPLAKARNKINVYKKSM
jgi:divalent metal cation (Fe/Co/Zn/Cd) transporter